jgi:hypothetical protein
VSKRQLFITVLPHDFTNQNARSIRRPVGETNLRQLIQFSCEKFQNVNDSQQKAK